MVECANCGHKWFQEINIQEELSSVPSTVKKNLDRNIDNNQNYKNENLPITNLPSTIVKEEKPSLRNSLIVVFLIFMILFSIWYSRSYGINTFVLIEFYIREFFFNINLIISDLAKIIHDSLN